MTTTIPPEAALADDHPGVDTASVHKVELVRDPTTSNPLRGAPGIVGIPTVLAGAIGLGITTTGALPAGAVAGTIAIVMSCTTIGVLIATVWAAALGQNAAASIYAVFFGFYASYAALILGLAHGWFGATPDAGNTATGVWLICWLGTIGVLTLVTLRMPLAFTILFALVDVALAFLIVGTFTHTVGYNRIAGGVVFAFVAEAAYLYADVMFTETGGSALPMGSPLVKS